MNERILTVCLQMAGNRLSAISRQILTTARALAREGGLQTWGIVFLPDVCREAERELRASGLEKITVFTGADSFCPEDMSLAITGLGTPEILLFPATPEGRALSSMTAARFRTGVTADCTALSFTKEGYLLQTRPAFSGSRLASIVTEHARPQIASLRFSMPADPVKGETELEFRSLPESSGGDTRWLDRTQSSEENRDIVLAVGGGLREKADGERVRILAEKLGADLGCSRELVDRGWLPRSCQVGLSGRMIRCRLLITLGVSGSQQFLAGIGHADTILSVDRSPDTPLMKLADIPIQCDLYEVFKAMEV